MMHISMGTDNIVCYSHFHGSPESNYVKKPMTFAVVSDCYREMNASGCMTKHKFPACVYEPDEEDDYNEVAL